MADLAIGDWSKLGSVVRDQRQRLGLSQTEAAARAQVSRSWLARVEAGHRGAELEQVLRLLDVLGLTLFLRTSERAGGRRGSEQLRSSHQAKMADRRRAWGEPGELRSGA